MKRILVTALLLLSAAQSALPEQMERATDADSWNFKVFLDDSEIGFHNFALTEEGDFRHLTTVADFQVKFLFFTAFSYEHVNEEKWAGDCLESIESKTVTNGKELSVSGQRAEDGFAVEATAGSNEVSGCIKTFAYWNPDILKEPFLMNSQTGELLSVSVEPVSEETLLVRGKETPATRYRLVAKNMELDVWYSQDQRWLALESTVKGGRKLRYELT